ncbi:TPA: HD domain-containing protein [Mannheimia haemolytica]|nr:HD domain-containing protein [Mannheimia haemolytica]MDY2947088.1 HD domain-containing protein [Mannheimia varigena]
MCQAEQFARYLHHGQTDKAGKPYIEHLAFVAENISTKNKETEAVAWLHDSVEDTQCSINDIRHIFGDVIADAVEAITKKQGESYFCYLDRVKSNPIAKVVKLADLTHNLCLDRLPKITEKDLKRAEKYKSALEYLQA